MSAMGTYTHLSLELEGLTLRLIAAHDGLQRTAQLHPAAPALHWTADGAIAKALHRADLDMGNAINEVRRIAAFVERLASREP